jgi:HSP20 family protein
MRRFRLSGLTPVLNEELAMTTLHQIRQGLSGAWDSLVEGWQGLYRRAAGAITRFSPVVKAENNASAADTQDIAQRSAGWGVLAAEVFDDDDTVSVRLEAPGMEKDDFSVQVHERYLVVRGEKQVAQERTRGQYYVTECAYGAFERAIPLPEEVDTDKARATYRNGVLRIELPKAPSRRRRTVKVEVK